jgi:hypothetical protein
MQKSRAQSILSLAEDREWKIGPAEYGKTNVFGIELTPRGKLFQHYAPHLSAAAGALALGTTGLAMHNQRQGTLAKIQQGGLGAEYAKAKRQLLGMSMKHALTLGANPSLGLRIQAQKRRVQDIENKGLERYHKGITQ